MRKFLVILLFLLALLLVYSYYTYNEYSSKREKLPECLATKEKLPAGAVRLSFSREEECNYLYKWTFWELFFRKNRGALM